MEEREKFEKWLSDLEAKKSSTPDHVFDRVKADYSLRLEKVLDKLRDHTSAMRQHAEGLTKKLEDLETEEQNLLDEQAENALRAEVGELGESEWESYSRKTEKALAKFQEDQQVISTDLERIRDLLGSLDGAAKEPDAAPVAAPAKKGMDEMEFLKSVVGATPPGSAAKAAKPPEPAKPEAPKAEPVKAEAPVAAPAPAEPPPPPPPPAPPESIISKPVAGPDLQSRGNQSTRKETTGPLSLKSTGSQDIPKTLKCAECGSMNYPSEWYCERCGAELANI